jgi:pyruvate, water dikinase
VITATFTSLGADTATFTSFGVDKTGHIGRDHDWSGVKVAVPGSDLVRDLGEAGAGDRAAVGGKGASLGELIRAGIRVPDGYVVTVAAFEAALSRLDPSGSIRREIGRLDADDPAAIAGVTERIRARVRMAPLPEDVMAELAAGYRGLGGDVPVAVRSSATGEDGAETSFAGLQDSYLWVRGARDLAARVRDCWASLYNAEAVGYRLKMKIPEPGVAMAVVVQRMVDPRCAGVMFTISPSTGDRSVIAVEGTWGLGSALVGGDVTPDSFLVSKVTGEVVRRTVAVKLRMHRAGPGGTGVTAADVPGPLRETACLDEAELAALAQLGRRVEEHYGTPQDIEWAMAGGPSPADSAVVLQSRPETVWSRRRAAPAATAKPSPVDHVFEQLGRVNLVTTPAPANPPTTVTGPER